MAKNVQKMSQNAFWGFLAASQKNVQKMSGKCPGAGVGAGKMSRKCQKNVPQTFSRHFFDIFWQIERWRPSAAPFWFSTCQKVSKNCLENVWGSLFCHFLDIFPAPAPAPGHFPDTFWTFFWEAARKSQKAFWEIFWNFFGNLSFWQFLVGNEYYKVRAISCLCPTMVAIFVTY